MKGFQAARLYEKGWPLRKIAKRFKVSFQAVQQSLKKYGTTLRPRGMSEEEKTKRRLDGAHPKRFEKAMRLLLLGEALRPVAKQFRFDESALRKSARRHGYVARPERKCGEGVYRYYSTEHRRACDICRLAWNQYLRDYRNKKNANIRKKRAREKELRKRREASEQRNRRNYGGLMTRQDAERIAVRLLDAEINLGKQAPR